MTKEKTPEELLQYRRQIDAIDDEMVALIKKRIAIVHEVGQFKRNTAPNLYPIRPGREAEMLRRITGAFKGGGFPASAAANIWRIIIGASTSVEAKLVISVFAPSKENDLCWLAREYFGPSISLIRQPHIKRVIGDVLDGKASVGLVPTLRAADTSYWWTNLLHNGADAPKIFAHLPFTYSEPTLDNATTALAFSRVTPEGSGDDVSLYVIETEHNTSQDRLQKAFSAAKIEAQWINITSLSPQTRHHLIEIKGFIPPEHVDMKQFLTALGSAVLQSFFLGAYAKPFYLANQPHNSTNHDKNSANA